MWGIINQIFSDLKCYRRLLGGHWYHVEVIVLGVVVSGWVRKPEIHEEITKQEYWPMLSAMFGESEFDSSNQESVSISIKIFDITGKNAVFPEEGQQVYAIAKPILRTNGNVELDFTDVIFMTAAFLNYCVGHLSRDYDRNQIKMVGLTQLQQSLVDNVLDNADTFYKQNTE